MSSVALRALSEGDDPEFHADMFKVSCVATREVGVVEVCSLVLALWLRWDPGVRSSEASNLDSIIDVTLMGRSPELCQI